jgi:hypothetical protein
MGVRRFRDASEMPPAPRVAATGRELWRRIAAWMTTSRRLAPRRWPPGLYRNRTIEEANARREAWQTSRSPM